MNRLQPMQGPSRPPTRQRVYERVRTLWRSRTPQTPDVIKSTPEVRSLREAVGKLPPITVPSIRELDQGRLHVDGNSLLVYTHASAVVSKYKSTVTETVKNPSLRDGWANIHIELDVQYVRDPNVLRRLLANLFIPLPFCKMGLPIIGRSFESHYRVATPSIYRDLGRFDLVVFSQTSGAQVDVTSFETGFCEWQARQLHFMVRLTGIQPGTYSVTLNPHNGSG